MPETTKKKKRPYLHEVDLMRIIFIFGVLLNHTTTAFSQSMANAAGAPHMTLLATHLLIHFTRMGFMFMTGLVLTLNYYHRNDWPTFFKKRFAGSGWPYVLWNIILLTASCLLAIAPFTWANYWPTLTSALLHGDQFYLYYIVVTLQLYVLFPFMVKLFQKVSNHNLILLVSFLVQLAVVFFIKYDYQFMDRSNLTWWVRSYGVNVFTYQFYFIFGEYTSLHYQQMVQGIRKHAHALITATLLLSVGTVPYYFWNRNVLGFAHSYAVSPHQPYMFVYDVLMILTIFWIGLKYSDWRQHGMPARLDQWVKNGAKVSFGIYLDQTIGLTLLRWILAQTHLSDWGYFAAIPLGYVFVLAVSFGIAWFCYKVPPFGILIGRPQWHLLKHNRQPKGALLNDTAK